MAGVDAGEAQDKTEGGEEEMDDDAPLRQGPAVAAQGGVGGPGEDGADDEEGKGEAGEPFLHGGIVVGVGREERGSKVQEFKGSRFDVHHSRP